MSKFSDSPYFLLRDFTNTVVAPPNPIYLTSDYTNMSTGTLYTDVIWIGGVTNYSTSSPYIDSLTVFPGFDESSDDAVIFGHDDVRWNGWIDRSPESMYHLTFKDKNGVDSTTGVLMRGMEKSIVVEGGRYINLWSKVDSGFIPVRLKPLYETPIDKMYFRFDEVEIQTLNYDGTNIIYDSDSVTDEPYFDSETVSIQTYDYTYDFVFGNGQVLEPGTEIYFRKDSSFHDWLKNENMAKKFYQDEFETDFILRNYVNTDKLFIYFGKIYPSPQEASLGSNRYHIVFYGLKDWVQNALPPNNRKELFIEFLDTYFDMVYSEGYQQLKDIWSLRDAMECNETFLSYIPTFYGIQKYDDIPSWFSDIYREYARDCVWLLKRKGTYASIYIITDLFTRNTNNILTVLERWHDDGLMSPVMDYKDHIYVGLYNGTEPTGNIGAGDFWYQKYDTATYPDGYISSDNKRLSPYYRVDFDLNVEPLTSLKIMPKQIAENLYVNWEMMRPIHRQAEYNFIYSPYCDLTGRSFVLYDSPNSNQAVTSSLRNIKFDDNNYIETYADENRIWYIKHSLGTENVIVSCWDDTFKKMIPESINIYDDNNVVVSFSEPTKGMVIITKCYMSGSPYNPLLWKVVHGFNRKEVIVQFRDATNNNVVYPDKIEVIDTQYIDVTGLNPLGDYKAYVKDGLAEGESIEIGGTPLSNTIWTFPTQSTVWNIEHGYTENIFMVNCYDQNNELIVPEIIDVNQIDSNGYPKIVVTFDSPVSGFAAIDHIGDAVSFSGTLPRNASGDLVPVEWRLTIETEEGIHTFIREGSPEANRFVNYTKTVNYWDGTSSNKNFVYGQTNIPEEDDLWAYYTFKVTDDALRQLNIKSYDILSIELVNTGVRRTNRQRIVFSRVSGLYKPSGVDFIGHFKIFKNPGGIDAILLDELNIALLDENNDYLYN